MVFNYVTLQKKLRSPRTPYEKREMYIVYNLRGKYEGRNMATYNIKSTRFYSLISLKAKIHTDTRCDCGCRMRC
jgi:hypothetical protein